MSKIICDVCGTRYPETADQCPICGHIRDASGKTAEDVLILDDVQVETHEKVRGGRFSKSNVKKRTAGAVPYEAAPAKSKAGKKAESAQPEMEEEQVFTEDKQNKRANTILNVLLVIVILALLAVSAYIFTQYIRPEIGKPEATVAPTEETVPEITEPVETEEPTYPCEELVLEEREVLLTDYEQKWLINVKVLPENAQDPLTFVSANELIATVDSEGCITALAEGQTTITITCGDVVAEYNVICLFPGVDIEPGEVPTDPPPTEPPVEYTVTTNYVNVRTGPSTGYDKVRQCNKGDKIYVYRTKKVKGALWGKLEDGWICLTYAKKSE